MNRRQSRVFFGGSRIPMPPPVSSEDVQRRGVSVDELGVISYGTDSSDSGKDELSGITRVSFMKKAIKAMVPSAKNPKRLSRMIVA